MSHNNNNIVLKSFWVGQYMTGRAVQPSIEKKMEGGEGGGGGKRKGKKKGESEREKKQSCR